MDFSHLQKAQDNAPSYLHVPEDGASFRCDECGEEGKASEMVIPFTPDGKFHMATHKTCLDEDWLKNAKDMGMG